MCTSLEGEERTCNVTVYRKLSIYKKISQESHQNSQKGALPVAEDPSFSRKTRLRWKFSCNYRVTQVSDTMFVLVKHWIFRSNSFFTRQSHSCVHVDDRCDRSLSCNNTCNIAANTNEKSEFPRARGCFAPSPRSLLPLFLPLPRVSCNPRSYFPSFPVGAAFTRELLVYIRAGYKKIRDKGRSCTRSQGVACMYVLFNLYTRVSFSFCFPHPSDFLWSCQRPTSIDGEFCRWLMEINGSLWRETNERERETERGKGAKEESRCRA